MLGVVRKEARNLENERNREKGERIGAASERREEENHMCELKTVFYFTVGHEKVEMKESIS